MTTPPSGRPDLDGRTLDVDDIADQPFAWPIGNHHELAQGHVITMVSDEVITPDGSRIVREYVRHPGAVAVIAVDVTPDGAERVVLVRQYRHPVGHLLLEPPAGLLDVDGEDWQAAAERELAEEVGLRANDWRVLVDVFTSPGIQTEALRIFLARDLAPADRPAGFVLAGEEAHMETVWAGLDDLAAAVLGGRVQNPALCTGILATLAARTDGYDQLRPGRTPWPAKD